MGVWSGEQHAEGGLARTGTAHDSHELARPEFETDVAQDGPRGSRVAEGDRIGRDPARPGDAGTGEDAPRFGGRAQDVVEFGDGGPHGGDLGAGVEQALQGDEQGDRELMKPIASPSE